MRRDVLVQFSQLSADIDILGRKPRVTIRSGTLRVPRVVLNVALESALDHVEGVKLQITRITDEEAHLAGSVNPEELLTDDAGDWRRVLLPKRLSIRATCGLTPTRNGRVSIDLRELSAGKITRPIGALLARLAPFIRKNIKPTTGVRRGAGAQSLLVLDPSQLVLASIEAKVALSLPPVTSVTGDGDGLVIAFG